MESKEFSNLDEEIQNAKRLSLIKQDFEFFIPLALEKIGELGFYLRTLENFIDSKESDELQRLKEGTVKLSARDESPDWTYSYPVHWDEIFRSRLRESFVIMLISFFEGYLDLISSIVDKVIQPPIKRRDLRGDPISQGRKYLKSFGRFSKPTDIEWEELATIYDVRCVIVHNNSMLVGSRQAGRIKNQADLTKGINIDSGLLIIERGYGEYCLDFINNFCISLQDEIQVTLTSYRIL